MREVDSKVMATMAPNGMAWVDLEHCDDGTGAQWHPVAWGGTIGGVLW